MFLLCPNLNSAKKIIVRMAGLKKYCLKIICNLIKKKNNK